MGVVDEPVEDGVGVGGVANDLVPLATATWIGTGGEIIRPQAVAEEVYSFIIPAGSRAIWLASRSVVPAEVEATSQDRRRLGVPLKRIVLREDGLRSEIGYRHPSLREGFHDDESRHRWTEGMARLPDEMLCPFSGDVTVEVYLIKPSLRYALEAPAPAAAPARRITAQSGKGSSEYPISGRF